MPNLDDQYDVDERYRAFEDHREGILVSLAGPGTGKTFSILRRVAALMKAGGIDGDAICYLTFIREIAGAFRADFEEVFGSSEDLPSAPRISTLHSLACRLLRNRGFSIGYDGELYFASVAPKPDTYESRVFIADLITVLNTPALNTIARVRGPLQEIKRAWRDGIDPGTLGGFAAMVQPAYLELARAYRLVDWDQTIPLAHELYQIPGNRQDWLTRIQHLLIDEYQDFNRAEQLLLSSIISDVTSAAIVGDDDQSLFSGRGGSPDGLRALFQSVHVDQVSLVRCRRCRSNIVDHANRFLALMAPNPRPMLPFQDGGLVESLKFKSSKAEIGFLAEFLAASVANLPDQPRTRDGIVCLFPTLVSLRFYLEHLSDRVSCHSTRHEEEASRIRLAHALSLSARPGQRFGERLLLANFPQINSTQRRRIVELVIERDIPPSEACQIMVADRELNGAAATSAQDFIGLCQALSSGNPGFIADRIVQWTEVETARLAGLLEEFLAALDDSVQETASSDLCDAALPSTARPERDPRSVQFLTIHGAKGLTKHTVVMPGLEDSWLPGTAEGADLAERRRLFYVALTRATDHVLITHPGTRSRGDPMNYQAPGRSQVSRFVSESGVVTRYQA
jgi:superfamily I DNA/RNA helicase